MKILLQKVLNTLGEIEVKGRGNLDKLLGAILVLENVISQMERGDADATDEHD